MTDEMCVCGAAPRPWRRAMRHTANEMPCRRSCPNMGDAFWARNVLIGWKWSHGGDDVSRPEPSGRTGVDQPAGLDQPSNSMTIELFVETRPDRKSSAPQ